MNVGYYFDRSAKYGNLTRFINVPGRSPAMNTRYLWLARYAEDSADPPSVYIPDLVASAADAVNKGERLHLNCNGQVRNPKMPIKQFFAAMRQYWSSVGPVEAADEPKPKQIPGIIAEVKDAIRSLGLPMKKIGVCFKIDQWPAKAAALHVGLYDIVIVEAYLDPPGDHNSPYNVDMLMHYLIDALDAVKKYRKKAIVVFKSYSNGGAWQRLAQLERDSPAWRQAVKTLVDLQEPTYKMCISPSYRDTVIGINFFSFGRESGAYGARNVPPVPLYPALMEEILRIGRKACRLT